MTEISSPLLKLLPSIMPTLKKKTLEEKDKMASVKFKL